MPQWEKICPVSDIPPNTRKLFSLGVWNILVFNLGNRFLASGSECAHLGLSLENAELKGHVVRCAAHGYQMDLSNGRCLTEAGLSIPVFLVEARDGWIWIKL